MTIAQELELIREVIRNLELGLSEGNAPIASYTIDGVSVSYSAAQLPFLREREKELAKRLLMREIRKRTYPQW